LHQTNKAHPGRQSHGRASSARTRPAVSPQNPRIAADLGDDDKAIDDKAIIAGLLRETIAASHLPLSPRPRRLKGIPVKLEPKKSIAEPFPVSNASVSGEKVPELEGQVSNQSADIC
jgi:hypothetical protein